MGDMFANPFMYLTLAGAAAGLITGTVLRPLRWARRPLGYRAFRRKLVPLLAMCVVVCAGMVLITGHQPLLEEPARAAGVAGSVWVLAAVFVVLPRGVFSGVVRGGLLAVIGAAGLTAVPWTFWAARQLGTLSLQVTAAPLPEEMVLPRGSRGELQLLVESRDDPPPPPQAISPDTALEVRVEVLQPPAYLWWWHPVNQTWRYTLTHSHGTYQVYHQEPFPGEQWIRPILHEKEFTVTIPENPQEWLRLGWYRVSFHAQRQEVVYRYSGE